MKKTNENKNLFNKSYDKKFESNKKNKNIIIFTWILTVISYLCFIICFVLILNSSILSSALYAYIPLGLSCIIGLIAHFVAKPYKKNGCAVQYYATFLSYFPIIAIVIPIGLIAYIIYCAVTANPSQTPKQVTIYTVYDKGYTRELIETDGHIDSIHNYKEYVDDIGGKWRSYDNAKTFIKEENFH